jgi:hypothetical protein
MTKAKNIAAKRKHADDEGSSDVPYDTEWSATPTEDTNTGLPFFRDTRANINSIVAHPETFHWVREFGDRDVLCWEKADKNSRKDIQLITIGEIKTADLEVPNNSSSFGSQGDLETSMIERRNKTLQPLACQVTVTPYLERSSWFNCESTRKRKKIWVNQRWRKVCEYHKLENAEEIRDRRICVLMTPDRVNQKTLLE